MIKSRDYIRKALLICLIVLFGYMGSVNKTEAADTSVASGSLKSVSAVTGGAITEETSEEAALYPVRIYKDEEYRYGYIDATGKMIMEAIYMEAHNFSEGYAVVSNGKKNQIINTKGKVIFESEGMIQDMHNGMAVFWDPKTYKSGYVNTKGKIVIKPKYNFAGDFREDDTAVVSASGKYYIIDQKGKILKTYQLSKKYNPYGITSDGYIIINDSKTFLKGVVNLDNKVILKPIYGDITYLGNDLFGVKKALTEYESYLISVKPAALFNKSGKQLTSYQYYDLSEFYGNYASATDSKYTYLINKQGKKVTTLPKFDGRGNIKVLGDVIQADIDDEIIYTKKDGSVIWKNDGMSRLSSGITVSTVKVKPNKYVVINYPKVSGLSNTTVQNTINKKLKTAFTKYRINIKTTDYMCVNDNFTVKQIKNLLIINKTGYDYPIGAAHGQPIRFYFFINVKSGDFYQWSDLFKKDSDYVTKLSKIVSKQMAINSKNGDMVYFTDGTDLISKNQYFYIDEDTLTICYDCGAIAAYAAGFPEFKIPFKDIMSIINTDGAFWKSFH